MYRLPSFGRKHLGFTRLHDVPVEGNLYTIVIGNNGTGKSRLLGAIASSFLKRDISSDYLFEYGPSRVLAVSNMVTDNYPYTRQLHDGYRYLGLRQATNNISTGSLGSSLGNFLVELRSSKNSDVSIIPILKAIDRLDYRAAMTISRRSETKQYILGRIHALTKRHGIDYSDQTIENLHTNLVEFIQHFKAQLDSGNSGNSFQVDEHLVGLHIHEISGRYDLPVHVLLDLLRYAFNVRFEMNLHYDNEPRIDGNNLSAGQLMLISMTLRILATVQPGSLILIDEPEVGLHPGWQSGFIGLLRSVLPESLGCHLFIATHSPYMVAEADNVLVPSHNAKSGWFEQLETDHRGMSIEDILYRVCERRLVGNSAVEADLVLVMDWLSSMNPTVPAAAVRRAAENLSLISDSQTTTVNSILREFNTRQIEILQ